jgi:hypothetical protein
MRRVAERVEKTGNDPAIVGSWRLGQPPGCNQIGITSIGDWAHRAMHSQRTSADIARRYTVIARC